MQKPMRCHMQAAATWMLECGDLGRAQQGWLERRDQEQRARERAVQREKEARKATVARWAPDFAGHAHAHAMPSPAVLLAVAGSPLQMLLQVQGTTHQACVLLPEQV